MPGGVAHSLVEETDHYSLPTGGVYVFNLIVGAGALAMPQAYVALADLFKKKT